MFNPNSSRIAIDTETLGLDVWNPEIAPFAVSMADDDGNTFYTEWKVDPITRIVTPDEDDLKFIQGITGNPNVEKDLFNLKFDARMLGKFGIKFVKPYVEVAFLARAFNTLEMPCALKPLSKKYCGIDDEDEATLQKSVIKARAEGKRKGWTLGEEVKYDYWMPRAVDETNEDCEYYARQDAIRTICLRIFYGRRIKEDINFQIPYEREADLWEELWPLEARGLYWTSELNDLEMCHCWERWKEARAIIDRIASEHGLPNFNPNSDAQVAQICFGDKPHGFGLPIEARTKGGQPKTDHKTLVKFSDNPFIRALFSWKTADKGVGFFLQYEKFARDDDPKLSNGKVLHPNLKQLDSRTCRFSCERPNLQQIPDPSVSHKSGDPISGRLPFGPRPGYAWYMVDYDGQEVRIFGDVGKIQVILDDAKLGKDFHTENTNRAWGGSINDKSLSAASYALGLSVSGAEGKLKEVWDEIGWNDEKARLYGPTSQEAFDAVAPYLERFGCDIVKMEASIDGRKTIRNRGKQVLFAKIFGGGAGAVQSFLFCSYEEARQFLNEFDEIFPGIKAFSRELIAQAREDGFIINPYHRKIMIERDFAYKCVNYMVQSTASDMMKTAMINCGKFLRSTGLDAQMVLTIHDELIFEIKDGHDTSELLDEIRRIMTDTKEYLEVPMGVEFSKTYTSWSKKIALDENFQEKKKN